MNKSTDYHDYVFRDGKLLGEFEEMYRNSTSVPWRQDEQADWIDLRLTFEMIRDLGKFDEIHDLGCGTGHYLDLMVRNRLVVDGKSFGYDISATACKKAADNFPKSTFTTLDLTHQTTHYTPRSSSKRSCSSLFMIRGTLWYVYPKLTIVIDNIRKMMSQDDRLLVVQNFPPLEREFIGKEVIPNYKALVAHFSSQYALDRHIWYEDRFGAANDNWFIGLFSIKD